MKRFINLGHQINDDKSERPQFAFYCTVIEGFETFADECVWDNIEDFSDDYCGEKGRAKGLQRYLDLIPKGFSHLDNPNPMKQLVDAFNNLFGDDLIQANLDKINAWAEKYNTRKE